MSLSSSEASGGGANSQSVTGEESTFSFDPSGNENEDVYGPPGVFDPSYNNVEVLYGPPEIFESSSGAVSPDDEAEYFDPRDNNMAILYGPPGLFDADDAQGWPDYDFSDDGTSADDAAASETAGSSRSSA